MGAYHSAVEVLAYVVVVVAQHRRVSEIFLPWIAWVAASLAAVVGVSSSSLAAVAAASSSVVVAVVVGVAAFCFACPSIGLPTQLNYSVGNCLAVGSGTLAEASAAFQLVAVAFVGCCTGLLIGCTSCPEAGSVGCCNLHLLLGRPSSWRTAGEVGCIAVVASYSAAAVVVVVVGMVVVVVAA